MAQSMLIWVKDGAWEGPMRMLIQSEGERSGHTFLTPREPSLPLPYPCVVLPPTALCFKSDSIKMNTHTEKELTPEGEGRRANG